METQIVPHSERKKYRVLVGFGGKEDVQDSNGMTNACESPQEADGAAVLFLAVHDSLYFWASDSQTAPHSRNSSSQRTLEGQRR